jgi:hypothetical protein
MDVFLKLVLGFIRDNWRTIAAVALVAGVYFYWVNLTDTIRDQKKTISQMQIDKATADQKCKDEKKLLTDHVSQQNTAIQTFQAQSAQNQSVITKAKDEVIKTQKYYNAEISKVLGGARPADCSAAIKYLVDGAKDFSVRGEAK